MADFEEKSLPSTLWAFLLFVFIEVLMIACFMPNRFIEGAIMKEQTWGVGLMGEGTQGQLKDDTIDLYTLLMIDSGINETVREFFVPSAEELERSKGWENLASLWFPFIESRGEALSNVIFHIMYRALALYMWLPFMAVLLVPSIFGGYMSWNIKRYNFDHSSPFLNTYSSKITWFCVAATLVSFIAPIPIPPMIIPVVIITLIPISCSLLIGNLPKRL